MCRFHLSSTEYVIGYPRLPSGKGVDRLKAERRESFTSLQFKPRPRGGKVLIQWPSFHVKSKIHSKRFADIFYLKWCRNQQLTVNSFEMNIFWFAVLKKIPFLTYSSYYNLKGFFSWMIKNFWIRVPTLKFLIFSEGAIQCLVKPVKNDAVFTNFLYLWTFSS